MDKDSQKKLKEFIVSIDNMKNDRGLESDRDWSWFMESIKIELLISPLNVSAAFAFRI